MRQTNMMREGNNGSLVMKNPLDPKVKDVKFTHPSNQIEETKGGQSENILRPDEAPGDVPDIGGEYTTAGVSKEHWTQNQQAKQRGS